MTVALYARRKGWALEEVTIRLRHTQIHAADCAEVRLWVVDPVGQQVITRDVRAVANGHERRDTHMPRPI